jgi:hypothetical protein
LVQAKYQRNKQCNQNATNSSNEVKRPDFHATSYATQVNAMQLSLQQPTREIDLKLQYNSLLRREQAGEKYLDDPIRTDAEVNKWMPEFNKILAGLNSIIDEIGLYNCTAEERLNGFNIIPLLGEEVSLDELSEEWKGVVDNGSDPLNQAVFDINRG